jgi:methyl-accepting chemotaxis protein
MLNVNIDYTITLGQIVNVMSTVGFVGLLAIKGGRVFERVILTIKTLSETVKNLSDEVKGLSRHLYSVDRRLAVVEGRTQKIIEEE